MMGSHTTPSLLGLTQLRT